MDLTEFGGDYVIAGWAEHQPDDQGGEGGVQYPLSKDAAIWYTNSIGAKQYHNLYGDPFFDEVATAIVQVDAHHYAICVHKTESYQRGQVNAGDSLLVYLLDEDGITQWVYRLGYEEAGVAPSHIIKDQQGFFVVVATRKNLGSSAYATEVVKIDPSGTQIWISAPYMPTGGATAHSVAEYGQGYVSIANNQALNYPSLLEIDPNSGTIIQVQNYPSLIGHYLFGFDIDPITDKIYAAGFSFPERIDTNAFVQEIETNYTLGNSLSYGKPEAELLYDVVATGDGFIAGGITNNPLSEGGWDDYILHIDQNLNVTLEETLGGFTDERFNRLMFSANLDKAWFGGHNIEYTVLESGNAYIGGVMNALHISGSSCDIPRIFLVDQLFTLPAGGGSGVSHISTTAQRNTIINHAIQSNANVLMLYQADIIMMPGSYTNRAALLTDLDLLCQEAILMGLRPGIIVGFSLDKINKASDFMDFNLVVNGFNYSGAGKVNFMMLEHEIWNPLVKNPNNQYTMTDYKGDNVTSYSNVDLFYAQLVQDHYDLLDHMIATKLTSANFWKSFDYLAYPFNTQPLNNSSSPRTVSDNTFRLQYTQSIEARSDAIFLMYYATYSWGGLNGRDFLVGTADWQKRLRDFGSLLNSSIFPLFSAEYFQSSSNYCGEGGDHLGKFLDGPPANPASGYSGNNFNSVENTYLSQHNSLTGVSSNVSVDGFGWYGYQCYKQKIFPSVNNLRVPCVGSGWISEGNLEISNIKLNLYPNPASSNLIISNLSVKRESIEVTIYTLTGKIVLREITKAIDGKLYLNLDKVDNGAYMINIHEIEGQLEQELKLIILK
jgi:hypothetical protein